MYAPSALRRVVWLPALHAAQETKALKVEALMHVQNKCVTERVKIFYIKCIYHYIDQ
jgi:hypothetical protein